MRSLLAFLALVLLVGCNPDDEAVETNPALMIADDQVITFPTRPLNDIPIVAFIDPVDQKIVMTGLPVGERYEPCMRQLLIDDEKVTTRIPTDQCVFMEEPKVWHGRWFNEFEGSVFCPAGANQRMCDGATAEIWLTAGSISAELGHTYSVSFVGRKTRYEGGYGHLATYPTEIVIDRLISIKIDSEF